MSTETKTKINRLISQWVHGTPGAVSYFVDAGFSRDLLVRYKKGGWLEPFGRGAYVRAGDKVDWLGGLYTLQKQLQLPVHAGGKTALELKGYAHYVPAKQSKIFLYGPLGLKLPVWFKDDRLDVEVVLSRTNMLIADYLPGFSDFKVHDFSVRISAPERAALEMLYLVPMDIGFAEAQLIMENLATLRPAVVQNLLAACRSVKVKRLFFYMAEKSDHAWLSQLDLSKIDLGSGKRAIISHGRYDAKYRITVPADREGAPS